MSIGTADPPPAGIPPIAIPPPSSCSSSALSSPSLTPTPRPIRGIKRRVPDHPTPLTERERERDGGGDDGRGSTSASPRKRQGRSVSASVRGNTSTPGPSTSNGTPSGSARKYRAAPAQSMKEEDEGEVGTSASASASASASGSANVPMSPPKSEEERREEEMLQSWKDEYFEIVEQLPLEMHRSSALMKELESQIHSHLRNIEQDTIAYRDYRKSGVPSTSPYRRHPTLDRISAACSMAMASAEEKVGLALSAYNLIDRHCRRLDSDLAKMTGAGGVQSGESAAVASGLVGAADPAAAVGAPFELRENTQESTRSQRMSGRSSVRGGASANKPPAVEVNESGPNSNRPLRARRTTGTLVKKGANTTEADTTAATTTSADTSLPDMPVDPNEPVYCYCRGPSSGTMVGCENEDCEREWFHLPCVGLTVPPPEHVKWYCKDCRPAGDTATAATSAGSSSRGKGKKRKGGR